MTTTWQRSIRMTMLLSLALSLNSDPNGTPAKAVPITIRAMEYQVLPSNALIHYRTKWSNDWLIGIDDDMGAPTLWVFDRSGKPIFNTMIQIPEADKIRLEDFASAPDGTIWAAVHTVSRMGQQSDYLLRTTLGEQRTQMIRTDPYRPRQLTVTPDGTVWTVGYEDSPGAPKLFYGPAETRDALRHFDAGGKQIGSALPMNTIGVMRVHTGFLAAGRDRIGWYSPNIDATGAYVEFSRDRKTLSSYPLISVAPGIRYLVDGFALTPAGRVFVFASSPVGKGLPPTVYELNRSTRTWTAVDVPHNGQKYIPMLLGNDGESLIFAAPDRSKVQVIDIPQPASH